MSENKTKWWRRLDPRHVSTAKWSIIVGGILAIVCHFLPHAYRAPCRAIAALCGAE